MNRREASKRYIEVRGSEGSTRIAVTLTDEDAGVVARVFEWINQEGGGYSPTCTIANTAKSIESFYTDEDFTNSKESN
jgi:hypothetical protein